MSDFVVKKFKQNHWLPNVQVLANGAHALVFTVGLPEPD
jgi:hypothetical protein